MIADASPLTFSEPFVLICAFVVGTLAVTRMVRLIVDDEFPPMIWLRDRYIDAVTRHARDADDDDTRRRAHRWATLVECPWCVAPYVTFVDLVWAWSTGLHWTWWFGNVWAAVSWLAAYLTLRDIPPEDRE